MNIEEARIFCLEKAGTSEGFPFDNETLVFKVMGKMFAIIPLEKRDQISLKCDPEYAIELREKYPEAIQGAWHLNKKHWNSVSFIHDVPDKTIRHLINHSYELVVSKLKKADREKLKELSENE